MRRGAIRPVGLRCAAGVEQRGDRGNRRLLEKLHEREFYAEQLSYAKHDVDRAERVPSEFEERVVCPDAKNAQRRLPNFGKTLFGTGARRYESLFGLTIGFRFRQRLAIDLAVWREGERVQENERGRYHVLRKFRAQGAAQSTDAHIGAGVGDDVGDEAGVAEAVGAQGHGALAHPRRARDRRLDLPELDAIATQLDLVVPAPAILQLPVGAGADHVTRVIHALRPASRRPEQRELPPPSARGDDDRTPRDPPPPRCTTPPARPPAPAAPTATSTYTRVPAIEPPIVIGAAASAM